MNGMKPITKADIDSATTQPDINLNLLGFLSLGEAVLAERRWALWRFEHLTDKWAKVPWTRYRTESGQIKFKRTGTSAKYASEWLTFREAAAIIGTLQVAGKRCDFGIAFMLGQDNRYVVIDLDNHRNRDNGQLTPEATAIVATSPTAAWVSNSLTGVHIVGLGTKPGRQCIEAKHDSSKPGYEIYAGSRFIALTGIAVGQHAPLANCTPLVSHVYFTHISPGDTPESLAKRDAEREAERAEVEKRMAARRAQPDSTSNRSSVVDRARAYLLKIPPAISGQGGHNATFTAACKLVEFDLDYADALALLSEWNLSCEPEWTNAELKHKLDGAFEHAARGRMLLDSNAGRDGGISAENYDALAAALPSVFGSKSKAAANEPPSARGNDSLNRRNFLPSKENQPGKIGAEPNVLGDFLKPPTLAEMQADVAAAAARKQSSRAAHYADHPEAINCHVHGFLYHPDRGQYRTARFACGRWCCLRCAKCLKRIWTQHLQSRIETQRVAGQPASIRKPRTGPVFVETVEATAQVWARLRKRLHRADAQYVRIRINSQQLLIVATRRFSDSCEEAKPAEASARVVVSINDLLIFGDTKKPIHTSKAWRLPRDEPSGWKYIGGLPASAKTNEILDAIRDLGGDPQTKKPPYPFFVWAADFTVPLRPGDAERHEIEGWAPLASEIYHKLSAILEGIELTPEAERLLFG